MSDNYIPRLPAAIRMGVALEIEQQRDAMAVQLQKAFESHAAMMQLLFLALYKRGPLRVHQREMKDTKMGTECVIERTISEDQMTVTWKAIDKRVKEVDPMQFNILTFVPTPATEPETPIV